MLTKHVRPGPEGVPTGERERTRADGDYFAAVGAVLCRMLIRPQVGGP
jgi:hypothetical protein